MKLLVALTFLSLALPPKVLAYLDPGSGSYFLQIAIGALLGGVYLTKAFWLDLVRKVSKFLNKLFKSRSDEEKQMSPKSTRDG